MTIAEMKELVMRQLQEDVEDVAEYAAFLDAYLDYGYVELMSVRRRGFISDLQPITTDNLLPPQYHLALVDYASYRILSNGNAQKQQRANTFLSRFLDVKGRMKSERDELAETGDATTVGNNGNWSFSNLYN